jgi:hypothetical protein
LSTSEEKLACSDEKLTCFDEKLTCSDKKFTATFYIRHYDFRFLISTVRLTLNNIFITY